MAVTGAEKGLSSPVAPAMAGIRREIIKKWERKLVCICCSMPSLDHLA